METSEPAGSHPAPRRKIDWGVSRARDSYEVRQMLRFSGVDVDSDREARRKIKKIRRALDLNPSPSKPVNRTLKLSKPAKGAKRAKGQYADGGLKPHGRGQTLPKIQSRKEKS